MEMFSNMLEGTRQYFMGLPKPAGEGPGPGWAAPTDEPAPAQSGAPTPTAPPPSAAAAPPPPRPPSEPIEPEPHIIHKATVMREAAEKRREQPPDDDDDATSALSPPPHIIRRPEPAPPVPVSPAPRPPSLKAPTPVAPSPETPTSRGSTPHSITPVARPPEHFTPARPPDPYSSSRPPEPYPSRYYEQVGPDGRPLAPGPSPQPPRHGSPQTYARMSNSLPSHAARLREGAIQSPPAQRYMPPVQPPPPHNDRVPPIHHPPAPSAAAQPLQRVPVADARSAQYPPMPQRRESSPYNRTPHYERHPSLQPRKYDPQQAYPGYRPSPSAPQPIPNHRVETHHTIQYKHTPVETISSHYPARPVERVPAPTNPYPIETIRRADYPSMSRTSTDARSGYHYPTPSTSSVRYAPTAPSAAAPVAQSSTVPPRPVPRPAAAPKSNYEYPTSNHVQTSPARSTMKPGYPNQQARMTVSVTSLVNQMNQTKQKRESPLDLSVKTVKNSADSSTTQDDVVDSASGDSKTLPLQQRPTSSTQHSTAAAGLIESHKVDFAPNFSQYRERSTSHTYPAAVAPPSVPHPVRYNGAYETRRPPPAPEAYPIESRHHVYPEHKYGHHPPTIPVARAEYVPRIDLTRSVEERRPENRIRDDRNFIIEDRKRPSGPIVSNIPDKIRRYETWTADSRIDRISQSAREQQELMSQPVYSYSSHKQFEAYQNEQRRLASATAYREHHHHHANHRYTYPTEIPPRERHDHHAHHHDRNPSISSRQVIQKIPSHRDIHPHHLDPHSGVPADKRVLSILRNSLETKQTGFVEPAKPARHIPDLIVIDDVEDSVIEITDLTKDNDVEMPSKSISRQNHGPAMGHHIKMPKAVDSIASEYQNTDAKSPPENDVARIRTKAELKGLPPSESILKPEEPIKITPKSQKQHLFNQIREDRRLESVIKSEKCIETLPEVKSEPMNIDEIEKDAVAPIKNEEILPLDSLQPPSTPEPEDLDWACACDSFMEQLKTGVHKKKTPKKRRDTSERESDKQPMVPKAEPVDLNADKVAELSQSTQPMITEPSESAPIVIKQEPIDEDEMKDLSGPSLPIANKTDLETNNSEKQIPPVGDVKDNSAVINSTEKLPKRKKESDVEHVLEDNTSVKEKCMKKIKESLKKIQSPQKEGKTSEKKIVSPEKQKKTSPEEESKTSKKKQLKSKKLLLDSPDDEKETKTNKTEQLKSKKLLVDSPDKEEESKTSKKEQIKTKKSLIGSPDKEKIKLRRTTNDEKNKLQMKSKKSLSSEKEEDNNKLKKSIIQSELKETPRGRPKKMSLSEDSSKLDKEKAKTKKLDEQSPQKDKQIKDTSTSKAEKNKILKKNTKLNDKLSKDKQMIKSKSKVDKSDTSLISPAKIKKEIEDDQPLSVVVKEEPESTDDDEPLIKSKMQKDKEMKYQLLKDLSEKSAYVKLECFDVDLNKNSRISIDSSSKDDKQAKSKVTRQTSKSRDKITENVKLDAQNEDSSSNSDEDDITVARRLRVRKNTKIEDGKATPIVTKPIAKSTPKKQDTPSMSNCSTPARKAGFGDGSDFHPGWEEELYKYKRSLRMPTRLIAIPRGRSGGPFVKRLGASFNRGSTSLPDLDPAPLSPAPSSAPSAATDDLYARRQDKLAVDSDLESNCSYSATNNRLQYDSEASTSTVFSSATKKKTSSSIVDVLIQKCGKLEANSKKKSKDKDKDDKTPKIIPKSTNPNELLPTPSLGLVKNGSKGILSAKKDKLMEDIFYLGAFRKETVNAYRNAFIKNTDGLIGATEEFAPVVLKSRTRTESRVLKQRATIKEVFGDERPASCPPTSCRDDDDAQEPEEDQETQIKKEIDKEPETKPKLKPKKIIKDKQERRSSSIRDGLRSTKSLKRNDAKGRLMRLKKRNSLMVMKSLANKRLKDLTGNKIKKEKPEGQADSEKPKEDGSSPGTVEGTKRRFKRLFGRRKFSSGFDYIRKKKKIIRREDTPNNKIRRPAAKPSPECEDDIQKEIKGWFINKSVGETHLHRAARLGYTDCVAYCLEKMDADASAKDNAGFTPLHVASAKGHVRIARLLLQYGANVSAAANGGIRPLHEACENGHVEVIRLLLAYGADPLLGTYTGQTPEELAEGPAARLLRLHIADVQGHAIEPWRFPPPAEIIDCEELGCDPLSSPPPGSPPPPPDSTIEMQATEFPLPPFYSLKSATGQPTDGLWCLLQDVTNLLQIKSKESLLKQIHCGSGSPKELLREMRTQEFLERAQCHQLLCAGEKVNVRASRVALIRVTDKLRQLLKIETVLIS